MSNECDWIELNGQDPFSDDPTIRSAVDTHVTRCESCREQLKAVEEADPLLKACFSSRMARAERKPVVVRRRLAVAGLAVPAIAGLLWLGMFAEPGTNDNPVPAVSTDESDLSDPLLAKPSDEPMISTSVTDPGGTAPPADPDFYVIDAAGYAYTLDDLRGSVVVLGVFSRTGTSRADVGTLYAALPTHDELQFIAVGVDESVPDVGPSLPYMVNRGSTLLGLTAGEFAILTRNGTLYRRGLLAEDGVPETVLMSLAELDISPTD